MLGTSYVKNNKSESYNKQVNCNLSVRKAADVCFDRLVQIGFDKKTASQLSSKFEAAAVISQINALPHRNPSKNKLGMLRRSIEENWPLPEASNSSSNFLPTLFATHVYATWAGNSGDPVSSPSGADIQAAATFLSAFKDSPNPESGIALAKRFGEFIRREEKRQKPISRSVVMAIRIFGDQFYQEILLSKTKQNKKSFSSKPAGQDSIEHKLTTEQIEILRQKKEELRKHSPALWQKFCEEEFAKRKRLEIFSASTISKELRSKILTSFDCEQSQLSRFSKFCEMIRTKCNSSLSVI